MFIFFVVLFTLMLMCGLALTGIGWYRKGNEELEEEERLQRQETSRAANPGTTDPMSHLRKKAEEGDARSQYEYGMMLIHQSEEYAENAPEHQKLYSFGVAWVKMSAKQSYGPALFFCGEENKDIATNFYQKNETEKFLSHSEIAIRYYRRAIAIGYPKAVAIRDDVEAAAERVSELRQERDPSSAIESASYQWTEGGLE